VVGSEERHDVAAADAEAAERSRVPVNSSEKVAGDNILTVMPETGPVAGGREPPRQALDVDHAIRTGKCHRWAGHNERRRLRTGDTGTS
jgi:hypothetical protein